MKRGRRRWWRVLGGSALMLAFVGAVLLVLVRQAGEWGVPYFSFTSAHGSPCKNEFTGYTCTPMTLADIEFFGDVDLPEDTAVVQSRYRATHDYELDAVLRVPKASAAAALRQLNAAYGPCRSDSPSPLPSAGLTKICVMASDDGVDLTGELSSRLHSVGTGLAKDGSRAVRLAIRSR